MAEVRAADERDARAVRALEDVGLRVEDEVGRGAGVFGDRRAGGLEDADPAVAFDVEKPGEGFGLGDAKIVARQETEPAALSQELAEGAARGGRGRSA
jgi:hypothetical protein